MSIADSELFVTMTFLLLLEKLIVREIKLNGGFVALVDDADFDFLSEYKWRVSIGGNNKYALTSCKVDGKWKRIRMHRMIMNADPVLDVDHINHNGLDNRRENLRACTRSENLFNCVKHKQKTSQFKGVHKDNRRNRYRATINVNKKQIRLGSFKTEEEAALAYRNAAKLHYGDFFFIG